jgi:diaminopimelate decarboxylase
VLKTIASEGLGFDVASGGELHTVLKAGGDPEKIYFHGNNKSKAELKMALEAGVGQIVVDNLQELDNLDEVTQQTGKDARILLRINPGIEAHTHDYIKTGTTDSKFGVPQGEIEAAVKNARSRKKIDLVGFHAHIGSQIFDVQPFVDETRLLLSLTRKYRTLEMSLGGGFGVPYLPTDVLPSIDYFAQNIASVLESDGIKLVLEPGRSIISSAGVTLYTIGAVKNIPEIRKYVFIDGGMSDNPRPILYQAQYDAKIVTKVEDKNTEKVTVAGRFCESGDILIKEIALPSPQAGDILAVACTGAYNYAMASNYNRVPRPAMVMVNNGQAKVLVRRETYDDLIRNDVL